jgi:hypothetical protein
VLGARLCGFASEPTILFYVRPSNHHVCIFNQDSSIMNNMYGFVDRLLATLQIVGVICVSL